MTQKNQEEGVARLLTNVDGMDLIFWSEGKRIYILNRNSEEAYFEYRWPQKFRYVMVNGDPLQYKSLFRAHGRSPGEWISSKRWQKMTWNHLYPDAGYRLYDAFHNLVENKASILFSLDPQYQFGSLAAYAGTQMKLGGHKGTHGALFKSASQGIVMTDDKSGNLPESIRYDELFRIFLPHVTKAYERRHGKREIQAIMGARVAPSSGKAAGASPSTALWAW